MNSERNVAFEVQVLGRWLLSREENPPAGAKRIGPKSTLTELILKSGNEFTGRVLDEGATETVGVFGYWDIREDQLRMGCSAEDALGAPVAIDADTMAIGPVGPGPGPGPRSYFRRVE